MLERHTSFGTKRRAAGKMKAVVLTAVVVVVGAIVFDVAMIFTAARQLRRAAGSAALTGARTLTATAGSRFAAARAAVVERAEQFAFAGDGLTLDEHDDVQFGVAEIIPGTQRIGFRADLVNVNAVRVRCRRTVDAPDGSYPTIFLALLGVASTELSASATAVIEPVDIVLLAGLFDDGSPNFARRMTEVAQAVEAFAEAIAHNGKDRLALHLISRSGRSEMDLTNDTSAVARRFAEIKPGDSREGVNYGAGIRRARQALAESPDKQAGTIVLLTNEMPTAYEQLDMPGPAGLPRSTHLDMSRRHRRPHEYALQQAEYARDDGIRIISVGLGAAVDRDLLTQLSEIYARVSASYFSSSTAADHPEDAVTLRETLRSIALNRSVRLVR